jgi:hypothetical protein
MIAGGPELAKFQLWGGALQIVEDRHLAHCPETISSSEPTCQNANAVQYLSGKAAR